MRNKCIGRRYVNPTASSSSLSALNISDLLGSVPLSSLRGLKTIEQEATAMDTRSSSDSLQLSGPSIQNLHTALPIGGKTRSRRKNIGRKRQNSGDDVVVSRRDEARDYSDDEENEEEMVTMSVSELENWQQKMIFHVENHFSNEQLKRIAEFGRVHGSIVQEAKQYVSNMETHLAKQYEKERAALRAQAEEFVAKTTAENKSLRHQVDDLTQQVEELEKKVDTLKWQAHVLRSDVAQNHREQDERQHEYCEQVCQTHSPSNNQAQVQHDSRETKERVENCANDDNHDANGHGSGSRGGTSSLQPAKQITSELIDRCFSSKPTDLTRDHGKDQLLPWQHQQLQSCNDESPSKITLLEQDGHEMIELSKTPAGAGELRVAGDG